MKPSRAFEFPPDKARLMARARRLEWWSLAYLVVATLVVALVLGQSQAMKTAWLDDVLNFIPVIAFLIATRISLRPPNANFPYGYNPAPSAAYLGPSVALVPIRRCLLIASLGTASVRERVR